MTALPHPFDLLQIKAQQRAREAAIMRLQRAILEIITLLDVYEAIDDAATRTRLAPDYERLLTALARTRAAQREQVRASLALVRHASAQTKKQHPESGVVSCMLY